MTPVPLLPFHGLRLPLRYSRKALAPFYGRQQPLAFFPPARVKIPHFRYLKGKSHTKMATFTLRINQKPYEVEVRPGTSLLWVLREQLGLTGTKYGCGIAQCGTCTIHVDDAPMRACVLRVEDVSNGQEIKTIEGLSANGDHPLQKAWIKAQAPQCGYCQPGQIMQAAALLASNPRPSRDEIKAYMNGVLCRCGTYLRIIRAIEWAAEGEPQKENA